MILPSSIGGMLTQEVGYLESDSNAVAAWLRDGLGSGWSVCRAPWESIAGAIADLAPSTPLSRYAVVKAGSWSLLLNNGPQGTDVGLLPSQAARELGCRAIRAVCVEDNESGYPARILELFGQDGEAPLLSRRSIVAANDGGKWVFEITGEPLPFERPEQYRLRRITERFTCDMLYEYLRQLGVPLDLEPDWVNGLVVRRSD